MTKEFTTLDLLNIAAWYKQAREGENKVLNDLPLKIQWNLKKIVSSFSKITDDFVQFQQDIETKLREEFQGDDKSYEATDEEGNQVRKIKDEYLDVFQQKTKEYNLKLNEILMEKNTISFDPIDIEALIDTLPEDTKLSVDDMEVIGLFYTEPIEITPSTTDGPVIG